MSRPIFPYKNMWQNRRQLLPRKKRRTNHHEIDCCYYGRWTRRTLLATQPHGKTKTIPFPDSGQGNHAAKDGQPSETLAGDGCHLCSHQSAVCCPCAGTAAGTASRKHSARTMQPQYSSLYWTGGSGDSETLRGSQDAGIAV